MENLYLGIDQGTSGTKSVLITTSGEIRAEYFHTVAERVVDGSKVEQDAESLLSSVQAALNQANSEHGGAIQAIGLACQRSGVTAWKRKGGSPLHPLITWADTRTKTILDKLGSRANRISVKTGIPTIANFAAAKIAILQSQFKGDDAHVGTLDSFILYHLLKQQLFLTEDTMAARTMLYNLTKCGWDPELTALFDVELDKLPKVVPSINYYGKINGAPLMAVLGDQQAAFLGCNSSKNLPLLNLGTIASLMCGTGDVPIIRPELKSSILYSSAFLPHRPGYDRDFRFLTEITSSITGTLLEEAVTNKKFADDLEALDSLCQAGLREGPVRIFTYSVLGESHEQAWKNGVPDVSMKSGDVSQAARACAWVENIGNLIVRMIEQIEAAGVAFGIGSKELLVSGGGSRCSYLLQYIADVTGISLCKFTDSQLTARGAATAALLAGVPKLDLDSLHLHDNFEIIAPKNLERRKRYQNWLKLESQILSGNIPDGAEVRSR